MNATKPVIYDNERKIWSAPNDSYSNYINQSVGEAFLQSMRRLPSEHVLDYFVDTKEQRTAGQIYRESVAMAKSLIERRFQKGDVLVVYTQNNPKATPAIMGAMLIGAIVNVFGTNLSTHDMDESLIKLQPAAIFYEAAYTQTVRDAVKRIRIPTVRYLLALDSAQEPNISSELLHEVSEMDLACFKATKVSNPQHETAIYLLTSGSTGAPKIVDMSHSMLLHGVLTSYSHTAIPIPPTMDCVVFTLAPLRWISQILMMFNSLLFGSKRVYTSEISSESYVREIIREARVTHTFFTPYTFTKILDTVTPDDADALSSLRIIQLGGDISTKCLRERTRKLCVNAKVYCTYGMSELAGVITNDERINGGQLTPGLQLQILDDNMQPLGPNARGQLYIKGPVPFKPYLKSDSNNLNSADGFCLNGDYGFVDAMCNLHVEARYKDLVRTANGVIIPSHVESVVNELPEVAICWLVGYKQPTKCSERGALFVRLTNEATNIAEEIVRQKIRDALGKIINLNDSNIDKIHIVVNVPLSCAKVNRAELQKQAISI